MNNLACMHSLKAAVHLRFRLFQNLEFFQGLESLSSNGTRTVGVVVRSVSSVDAAAKLLLQSTDTNIRAEIDMTSNSGCSGSRG